MKKLLFIVNPRAGQQKAKRLLCDIIDIFNRAGYAVTVYITSRHGDGEETILRQAGDADLVVCTGGDGTFNETLSGVLRSGRDLPIGYIPAGSTNDFAVGIDLSTDLLQAARDVVSGEIRLLDVGRFNGRYFSYVASFGLFTKISYSTPQSVKNALGHAAYVLNGVQELSQIRSFPMRFELPDGRVIADRFIFGAVSNSVSMGGILNLSGDRVDLADGKLELLLIREPADLWELRECFLSLQNQTYDHSLLTFLSTDRLRITAPKDADWSIDGERQPGAEEIEVECLHRAAKVFVGRSTQGLPRV